ncbi:hypothetical protein JCM10213_001680 [Rhodosporidiobolus nylandii]
MFITAESIPTFSFGLDTPNKFLNSTSPTPWSLGGGLTPSLFSSLGSRGFTPSFSNLNAPAGEANPFELSLSAGASRRHSMVEEVDEPEDGATANEFDLFSSSMLMGGRKRALSSPAIYTPGGTNYAFLAGEAETAAPRPQTQTAAELAKFAFKPLKRPRMDSMASSSTGSGVDKVFSDSDKRADSGEGSPASSVGLSPADVKIALPSIDEHTAFSAAAIDVSAAPSLISQPAPAPQPANLFAQLEQHRTALMASGTTAFSQAAPLPMKGLSIKPEPMDDVLLPPAAPRPPVTRGQSKKGKAPEASTSKVAAPAPAPQPKRKGGRKKAAATAKPKKEGDGAGEEDDEDALKRKQFLERNRIAACKSRAKKKEKMGQMEQHAADLCERNRVLQQTALALRSEAIALRAMMLQHIGCSCEHAQGYIARDAAGGGIATIDQLAGRTLTLDYTHPPALGTDDDVYAFIDRNEPGPPPIAQLAMVGAQPVVPLAARPSFIAATGPPPSSQAIPEVKLRQPSEPAMLLPGGATVGGVATRSSAARQSFALPAGTSFLDPSAHAMLSDIPVRSTSAPPTTPGGWAAPQVDYFAPKELVAVS